MSVNRYDWNAINEDWIAGLSYKEIQKKFGVTPPNIWRAYKSGKLSDRIVPVKSYDWNLLQQDYDAGMSHKDLQNKWSVSPSAIRSARIRGEFKSRTSADACKLYLQSAPPRKHSEATKLKISNIRRKFLEANPDKVPYLINHSSKKSYPEVLFENALIAHNITGWQYNFQNGIYQYDFAFVDIKLDVEVDGGTHLTEKVKKIDARRDDWSKSKGWNVLRFTAKEVKDDVDSCIEKLKKMI